MLNNIEKAVQQVHQNVSFDLSDWDKLTTDASTVSVFHLKSTVEYYCSYYDGKNLSFIIVENNEPIALLPLLIHEENGWKLSSNGEGLIGPLFKKHISRKLKKRVVKEIVEIVELIGKEAKSKKIRLFEPFSSISNWYLHWLERADNHYLTYQMGIDLNKTLEEIRLDFRKSYKPLVNKALREWQVEICEKNNIDSVFDEFRLLHLEAAGKITRSEESWEIQKKQIKNNEAFLVTVRDKSVLIGAGFFNHSKDIGMYSVGAYRRDLFDKPIGHAVQMLAITKLKDLGCKVYHLGQKAVLLHSTSPSKKEISISHFKEGFAGYIYTQPHLEVNLGS